MREKHRTILIVDDCPEDREVYRRYLRQDCTYTYQIFEEEYGENGLQLCKQIQPIFPSSPSRLRCDSLGFETALKFNFSNGWLRIIRYF